MKKDITKENNHKRYNRTFYEFIITKSKLANTSLNDQQRELLDNIWQRLNILYNEIEGFTMYKDPQTGGFKKKQEDKNLSLEDVNKECKEIEKMLEVLPIKKQRAAKYNKIFKKYPQNRNPNIE
jgi:hypothetical protein